MVKNCKIKTTVGCGHSGNILMHLKKRKLNVGKKERKCTNEMLSVNLAKVKSALEKESERVSKQKS